MNRMIELATGEELLRSTEVLRGTGITYRQLDYWARCGLITPEVEGHGSGSRRLWRRSDQLRLRRLARLQELLGSLSGAWVVRCWHSDLALPLVVAALPPEHEPEPEVDRLAGLAA